MFAVLQTFRLAVGSLLLHKLRSGLAVVGVLIGITAVIWLVAFGEGVSYQAQEQIKELGAKNIIVRSVKPSQNSSQSGSSFFLQYGVLRADFDRIMSNIETIEQAVPVRVVQREVRNGEHKIEARVVGSTAAYFDQNHLIGYRGRFVSDEDDEAVNNVCVLAANTARELFPLDNPIGNTIQIDNDFYVVVGETASRDPSAAIGGSLDSVDYNSDVYIPLQTLRRRIGDMVFTSRSGSREGEIVELTQITLSVSDFEQVEETADIIRTLLDTFHPNEDVKVVVPKELLQQAKLFQIMFNVLLVLIASISLLVGGIGIMNIMLATVTERTREIGIRRALGATRMSIIYQFLVEAVVLTGVGGLLGVAFGFLCKPVVIRGRVIVLDWIPDEVLAEIPPTIMKLEPRIAPWSIIVSVVIAILVGVCFGLGPAIRAALMDPIEALRHE
ncbi:MAG: ABC transporter permease [Pirellulaceae bacterium]|nr:ABC transporter permease [Pirellulaceae bacterium]